MSGQNYSSHSKFVSGYHRVLFTIVVLTLIGAIRYVVISIGSSNLYGPVLILMITIALIMTAYFARVFALKAQDRAIRAEENLRHYVQHGSLLPGALTIRQIVGLRFASDDEFEALAASAARDGTSEDDIKKSIQNWKTDTDRV